MKDISNIKCLNLGCGVNFENDNDTELWINADKYKYDGVDKVVDFNKLPYPFKDNEFDKIRATHVLEHLKLDTEKLILELKRITKKGGIWIIKVPHHTDITCFNEFHNKLFCLWSFHNRCGNGRGYSLEDNIYSDVEVVKRRIHFHKGPMLWNYLIEKIVNINHTVQHIYEFSFLKFLFPAKEIYFEIIVKSNNESMHEVYLKFI